MVRQIDLTKSGTIDLTKQASAFDLTKKGGTFDLTKPEDTNSLNFKKKPPKFPKTFNTGYEPNFTDPLDELKKIDIPILPFDLYYTDPEPADPQDCARYPNSPWCGGNPFSKLPIGIQPEIILDPCNVGVSLQPILFFIKLPQHQVVLRNKACRDTPQEEPPLPDEINYEQTPYVPPYTEGSQKIVIVYQDKLTGFGELEYTDPEYPYYFKRSNYERTLELIEVEFPYMGSVVFVDGIQESQSDSPRALKALARIVYKVTTTNVSNVPEDNSDYSATAEIFIDPALRRQNSLINDPISVWVNNNAVFEYIDRVIRNFHTLVTYSGANGYSIDEDTGHWTVFIKELDPSPKHNPPPPPLLKIPSERDDPPPPEKMDCCPQVLGLLQYLILRVSQVDERVKLLDEQIKDTNKCLGTDEYPASLPKSLISKDDGWLGNLIPDETVQVTNLTGFVAWFFERMDEVIGQWTVNIEVKDSDPATPGDQPKGFKIPNLAEYAAESFGLLLQAVTNLELLVNMQTRTLIEVGQDKQQNFISYKLLQALVDYINFDYKDVQNDLPMMFKPGEEQLDKMLVETITKVTVAEFDDKIDFQRHLLVLLEMAKMWKAQNFKKLDLGDGMKQQILDRISGLAKQSEELSIEKKDADGKDEFDRFCEDVETQFATEPGILDAAHPYGGEFEDRPKIKKLGQ